MLIQKRFILMGRSTSSLCFSYCSLLLLSSDLGKLTITNFFPALVATVATNDCPRYFLALMFFAAWFLNTHKGQELYQLCLNHVLLRTRDWVGRLPAPIRLVSDYELAILQSMSICFPTGKARDCSFHSGNVKCVVR